MSNSADDQDLAEFRSSHEEDQSSEIEDAPKKHEYEKASTGEVQGKTIVTKVKPEHRFLNILQSPLINVQVGSGSNTSIFQVPKDVLIRSPVLAIKLNTEDQISFPDEDPSTVASFLEYQYTSEYFPRRLAGTSDELEENGSVPNVDNTGEQLIKHAKIYFIAQKLQIPELQSLATSKINRIRSTAAAEVNYARYVYDHSDEKDKIIRGPVMMTWAHRAHVLRHEVEGDFEKLCREVPRFGYDVLTVILDAREQKKRKQKPVVEPNNGEPAGRAKRRKLNS